MSSLRTAVLLSLLASCGGEQVLGEVEGAPAPICDRSYTQRVRVRVDARSYLEPLVDFPVLLELTPERFDYDGAGPAGEGIRITSADCEVLRHEIDGWDPGGTSRVWVNVPVLPPGEILDLFLFFGQVAPEGGARPNEVFNEDYVAVYHLEGDSLEDASVYRRRASDMGTEAVEGRVGGGRRFGSGASLAISDASFSQGLEPRTACMWARSTDDGRAYYWMFAHGTGESSFGGFAMNRHGTIFECLGGDGSRIVLRNVFPEGDREWRYVCCSYDGVDATLWSDGNPLLVEPHDWSIGLATGHIGRPAMPDGGANSSWRGGLDEVRVSRVARSADWIMAEHASMIGEMVTLGEIDAI